MPTSMTTFDGKLAGRDVHPWLIPEALHEDGKRDALVGFDKIRLTLPNTGMRISQHDFGLTVWPGDMHAKVGEPNARLPQASRVVVPEVGHGIVGVRP